MATVKNSPPAIPTTAVRNPVGSVGSSTGIGLDEAMNAGSPSCPSEFDPQHRTVLSPLRPMLWRPPPAMATMSGLLVGYIIYDMVHYYTHHAKPKSRIGKYLKRYHLAHHHKEPDLLFGVRNPLWDIVFRTGFPKKA